MSKHEKNSSSLQFLESARSIPIEIPLPMLAVLESVENAFFELCVASRSGSMIVRWVSAALLEAERHFRRVRGYRDLQPLVRALEAIEREHGVTVEKQVA